MSARLDVRLEAFEAPIGVLEATANGAVSFAYHADYAGRPDALPLSVALPLTDAAFDDPATRVFFDNLLPENDQLRDVMERHRIARDDVVGLLGHLGADCSGAVSCLLEGAPAQKVPGVIREDYDALDRETLFEIVRRLANRESLFDVARDPSPLAGVQRKIALTEIGNGVFGLPKKGRNAPTTHILKVPSVTRGREAALEAAAAGLGAAALKMRVAVPEAMQFGDFPAVLVRRFDRTIDRGLIRRVHQEDFAQALGLPARMKYERNGEGDRRFSAEAVTCLLDRTAAPVVAKRDFLLATIFNFLIGNTDNHAKNHALIYEGADPAVAPLYDLPPTLLDPNVSHEFSLRIGDAAYGDELRREDLERLMAVFGFARDAQRRRLIERDIRPLAERLERASASLVAGGLKDFDDLVGRQIRRLNDLLGLGVALRDRDHFQLKGGGWGLAS